MTQACGSKINTSTYGMIEIGNNIRWVTDDCEWTITANDPSIKDIFCLFNKLYCLQ